MVTLTSVLSMPAAPPPSVWPFPVNPPEEDVAECLRTASSRALNCKEPVKQGHPDVTAPEPCLRFVRPPDLVYFLLPLEKDESRPANHYPIRVVRMEELRITWRRRHND